MFNFITTGPVCFLQIFNKKFIYIIYVMIIIFYITGTLFIFIIHFIHIIILFNITFITNYCYF